MVCLLCMVCVCGLECALFEECMGLYRDDSTYPLSPHSPLSSRSLALVCFCFDFACCRKKSFSDVGVRQSAVDFFNKVFGLLHESAEINLIEESLYFWKNDLRCHLLMRCVCTGGGGGLRALDVSCLSLSSH
jgi:hypothetical protein